MDDEKAKQGSDDFTNNLVLNYLRCEINLLLQITQSQNTMNNE